MNQGTHLLIDGYGINPQRLADYKTLEFILKDLPTILDMTAVSNPLIYHTNQEAVNNGAIVIAESHVSYRTREPSINEPTVQVDIFSCKPFDQERAVGYIKEKLGEGHHNYEHVATPTQYGKIAPYSIRSLNRGSETHLVLDVNNQDPEQLKDAELFTRILRELGKETYLEPQEPTMVPFTLDGEPAGVTGILLGKEGEIAVHTYPEIGYFAMDLTGTRQGQYARVYDMLKTKLTKGNMRLDPMNSPEYQRPLVSPTWRIRSLDRGIKPHK